jgi:hypothetical protein
VRQICEVSNFPQTRRRSYSLADEARRIAANIAKLPEAPAEARYRVDHPICIQAA